MWYRKDLRRTGIATLVGTFLEQHDFVVYAHLLPVLTASFLGPESTSTHVFLVFAVGYLCRPLGGLFFGHFGDRFGRKGAMLFSISIMSIPTLIVGVLPTYAQIGVAAGVILYLCRALQSISVSGEVAGAAIIMIENAPPGRKCFAVSVFSSVFYAGGVVGALSGWIFTQPFMPSWAWRFAFLIGSLIALVGFYFRSKALETPEFELILKQNKVSKTPVLETLKKDWTSHLCYIGLVGSSSCVYSYIIAYVPRVMKSNFGYSVNQSLVVSICFTSVLVALIPLSGFISDKIGPRKVIAFGNVLVTLLLPFALRAMEFDTPGYFFLFQALACVAFAIQQGPISSVNKYMYPTERRYSGSAFGQGLGTAIIGGFTPLIMDFLQRKMGGFWGPSTFIIYCQLGALLGVYFAPNFDKKDLIKQV
jgi:MFS transporter, MHS family, proline/betaine transporter